MRPRGLAAAGAAALSLAWPTPLSAQGSGSEPQLPRVDIAPHVREAAQRFGIPERWILAVIRVESAGRTRAMSSAGAMGLMQLMPGTWARQRARFGLGSDPFDPRDNILAGTSYLREMYDRYGAQGFLAAYNAGPGRYEQWRDRGRNLPLETHRYVAAIAPLLQRDRLFAAATLPSARASSEVPPQPPTGPARPFDAAQARAGLDAYALVEIPSHDLFAPVSTAIEP